MKRLAILEDLSEFGRCSMTVALPVVASCGVECVPLVTSLLSTHMGLPGFCYTDLTDTLRPAAAQYRQLGLHFDGIYIGFLGSESQQQAAADVCAQLRSADTRCFLDPVMGDNGRRYHAVTDRMVDTLRSLCRTADVITPNPTEAAFLLGRPAGSVRTVDQAQDAAQALRALGAKTVFLTGIPYGSRIGVLLADGTRDPIYLSAEAVDGAFHGTGDLFASALFARMLRGEPAVSAAQQTVEWITRCARFTANSGAERRFGIQFEPFLHELRPVSA